MKSFAIATALLMCTGVSLFSNDIDFLHARLAAQFVLETPGAAEASLFSAQKAEEHLSTQKTDGSWADIPYGSTKMTNWEPLHHLFRLRDMAVAHNKPGHPAFRSSAMRNGISRGLDYWFKTKPRSDNWWFRDIGPQLQLGPIMLLMKPHLTAQQIETGAAYFTYRDGQTGQNLIWFASQLVFRGCLLRSSADIQSGISMIGDVIVSTTREGIQPDFSFHQHGAQLYSSDYGSAFIQSTALFIGAAHGLSFAPADAKYKLLVDYMLDGTQWMVRRGFWGESCRGRDISRPWWNNALVLSPHIQQFIPLAGNRSADMRNFLAHLNGERDESLIGNKHFWRSDFQAHRRKEFLASLRMTSKRLIGSELINAENLKGYYRTFGSLSIQVRGDEYDDIYPVWDWALLPGVTGPHKSTIPAMPAKLWGTTDFVGGASDGLYGAAAMDLNLEGVTGKKSWFFFDREVVALGAEIKSVGNDPVKTGINQANLRGEAWIGDASGAGRAAGRSTTKITEKSWIHHDSVGYLLLAAGEAYLRPASQSGSWFSINNNYPSDRVDRDVFSLWIDHGVKPANGSYAYAVLPGVGRNEMTVYAEANPIRVLSNTARLQAVRHMTANVTGAVFMVAGEVELHDELSLKVDKPCVAVAHIAASQVKLTLANPLGLQLTVVASLLQNGKTLGTLTFQLHGDAAIAGRSVTQTFRALRTE